MEKKSGFVTLIGRPNVGKSTLMNKMVGAKIAITSSKPQTTRTRIQTVLTKEEGQIIFVDTPGIHKAKNKLGEYMVDVAKKSISDVDVILWLVEPGRVGSGDRHIADELKKITLPIFLIINKIDSVSDDEILNTINYYKDLFDFAEIVPLSAKTGLSIDILENLIFKYLPKGPQLFASDTLTDQPERQIMAEYIREKALYNLKNEIPHGINVLIDSMKDRKRDKDTIVDIDATIVCEKDSHKGMIIGKKGAMLKKIGSAARFEMEKFLRVKVNLKLWVKVKEDWRDSDFLISNFGYKKER